MKAIHIREVKPQTLAALKRLARSHHRSLQGELRMILERAARMAPAAPEPADLGLVTAAGGGSSSWGRDQIYGDHGR